MSSKSSSSRSDGSANAGADEGQQSCAETVSVATETKTETEYDANSNKDKKPSIAELMISEDNRGRLQQLRDLHSYLSGQFGFPNLPESIGTVVHDLEAGGYSASFKNSAAFGDPALSPAACELLHWTADLEFIAMEMCKKYRHQVKYRGSCDYCTIKDTANDTEKYTSVENAFAIPFNDRFGGVEVFKQAIIRMLNRWKKKESEPENNRLYAPSVTMIQCSGSGKSRLVAQLALDVPLIYICYRSRGESGYPPCTPLIFDYLLAPIESLSSGIEPDVVCYVRAAALMGAINDMVAALYRVHYDKNRTADDGSSSSSSSSTTAADVEWDSALLQAFFNVQSRKNELKDKFWFTVIERSKVLVAELLKVLPSSDGKNVDSPVDLVSLEDSIISTLASGDQRVNENGIDLVICFDETKVLNTSYVDGCRQPVMTHIHRASRLFSLLDSNPNSKGFRAAVVMIDTLCELPIMNPAVSYPSDRIVRMGSNLTFFTDLLTWDLDARYSTRIDVNSVDDKAQLAKFGRPLWNATVCASSVDAAVKLASSKLIDAKITEDTSKTTFLDAQQLKAAAVICCSSGVPLTPFALLARKLVQSHQGHLRSLDVDKQSVEVSYPSDPFLASAARRVWRQSSIADRNLMLVHFGNLIKQKMISAGYRGEFVSTLLCLEPFCCDRSRSSSSSSSSSSGKRTGPDVMTVRDWLKSFLLADESTNIEVAKSALPILSSFRLIDGKKPLTSASSPDTEDALLNGSIHLSHFVTVKDYTPNRADLFRFFQRGAGVICKDYQPGFDLIIPVALKGYKSKSTSTATSTVMPAATSVSVAVSKATPTAAFPGKGAKRAKRGKEQVATPPFVTVTKGSGSSLLERKVDSTVLEWMRSRELGKQKSLSPEGIKSTSSGSSSAPTDGPASDGGKMMQQEGKEIIGIEHMSYILIQSKAHMSSSSKTLDINVDVVLESSIEAADPHTHPVTEQSAPKKKVKQEQQEQQRQNLQQEQRPYAVIGMFFTHHPDRCAVVHELKSTVPYDSHVLRFAITNPHHCFSEINKTLEDVLFSSADDVIGCKDAEYVQLKAAQRPMEYKTNCGRPDDASATAVAADDDGDVAVSVSETVENIRKKKLSNR